MKLVVPCESHSIHRALHALQVYRLCALQEKRHSAPGCQQDLEAERASHADTKSKLASTRANLERKAAFVAELRGKLDAAQAATADAASAQAACKRLEEQLKDANAALGRKDARLREVRAAVHQIVLGRIIVNKAVALRAHSAEWLAKAVMCQMLAVAWLTIRLACS